jgi:hypothetical protein
MQPSPEWAWPDDVDNPLAHLTSLAVLDLASADVTHLGCDAVASLRGLVELALPDNAIARLDDVSIGCAGVRLARLIVAGNRLSDLDPECLSGLVGLVELDASRNPFVCGAAGGIVGRVNSGLECPDPGSARSGFLRWLNTTAGRRVTIVGREMSSGYRCRDRLRESYVRDIEATLRECPESLVAYVSDAVGSGSKASSTSPDAVAADRRHRTAVFVGATVLSTVLTLLLLLPVVFCLVVRCGGGDGGAFGCSGAGYQLKSMSFVSGSHRKLLLSPLCGRLARLVRWRRQRSAVRYREVSGDFDIASSSAVNEGANIDTTSLGRDPS